MTKAKWREVGIYNSHSLVSLYAEETGQKGVYFGQSANDGSRMDMGVLTGYFVYRPGFQTDPDGRRFMNKNKEFGLLSHHNSWDETLKAAEDWAFQRYGTGVAVAIPGFGRDRFPEEVAVWAKEKLKTL